MPRRTPPPAPQHAVLRLACGVLFASTQAACAGDAAITPTEQRWLQAGRPVIAFARRLGLPLDIVVQPQDAPGLAPLAMAHIGGRCKLVLSMRGNPEAEDTLDGVPAGLEALAIEAMTAHEVGHCWRHAQGAWHRLPAGFVEAPAQDGDADAASADGGADAAPRAQRAVRREEAFADLCGLAWTLERHPARYVELQRWMAALRAGQRVPEGPHDTLAWIELVAEPGNFDVGAAPPAAAVDGGAPPGRLFERARRVWQRGLGASAAAGR